MLEDVYLTPRGTGRADRCWLGSHISGYFHRLAAQGFKRSTLATYANRLLNFGEFLDRRGIRDVVELPGWIEPFVEQLGLNAVRTRLWQSTLNCFVRYLIEEKVIPAPEAAVAMAPHAELVEQYAQFLHEHRGVCHDGLRYIRRACRAFLDYVRADEAVELREVQPEVIHRFITAQGQRYARKTVGSTCSAIRGFLGYLYRRGMTSADLSGAVVSPRIYKHEQCPQFLTHREIEAVLAAIDRQTPQGRRDYAMLLLLAVYGLRGIEVIRLRLDDIDWRNLRLHVRRRKAGNHSIYPLAASVGEAILTYLKNDRPPSPHREVFLSMMAPFAPLAYSASVARLIRNYMAVAGVQVDRPGTHTFRYSCAQRLFEQGIPLKSVGDYLGHQDPGSTQRYTKIAIEQLREVALGDGEELL